MEKIQNVWYVEETENFQYEQTVGTLQNVIAKLSGEGFTIPESEAHAHLIAAAPALLTACERMRDIVDLPAGEPTIILTEDVVMLRTAIQAANPK